MERMNAPTDETLLERFQAGDGAGFELLVRRHSPEVYRFVLRFTQSSVAAEDVVQETFLQLYRSADQFDASRRVKPWLFTIAANKARDYLRRRGRKREVPLDAPIDAEAGAGRRFVDMLAKNAAQDDADAAFEERRHAVRSVVEQMPDRLREVLVLAYFHRFPYRQVAEITGVPLGTVKSRLHAAITHFGRRYREHIRLSGGAP